MCQMRGIKLLFVWYNRHQNLTDTCDGIAKTTVVCSNNCAISFFVFVFGNYVFILYLIVNFFG
jgi:hypothetical protein